MTTDHLSPVWSHLTTANVVRGEGVHLYEADGTRWTDFTSGIGVVNTGHAHPHVVAAIRDQAERLLFAQMNVVLPPLTASLAERLAGVTPDGIDSFFFTNSGSEATEAAVKLARHATGRRYVVVFHGSFHGRSHLTMAMTTSKTIYRRGYAELAGGIVDTPFPYAYRYGWDEETAVAFALRELDTLFKGQCAPDETAAIVIEPVLGEGGYVPAPRAFLEGLRERADRYGIMLVIDEVQTGFGRTGTFWNVDRSGVRPDMLIMAKGLGSGLPIAAIGASLETMSRWQPGTHGGTYAGGSLVSIAAAHATLDVMIDERLPEAAEVRGEGLRAGLRDLQRRFAVIGDVRGPGLMVGVEFTAPDGTPDAATAKGVQRACLEERLLLLTCGTFENVIRWIPPLVVSEEEIDDALAVFGAALDRSASLERVQA
ncbi:aminotransferase class III-fold pyridoxal phosphate-dependent enzyme [soil metagenome]|nr:aminotransferase class III-fold pyridoxal phosphate-dependent enzyme [Trueperaceae bacterium]